MKLHVLRTAFALILGTATLGMAQTPQRHDTIINYGQFKGHPVQLVFDGNRVTLRVRLDDGADATKTIPQDDAFAYLRDEVVKRLATGKSVHIAPSGFVFTYTGGHPLWGPYTAHYQEGHFACLEFAENGTVIGKEIYGGGRSNFVDYDGYKFWEPY